MTDQEAMLAGRMMPPNHTKLVWLLAESRARGIECAAEDARIFGHDELADHLCERASAVRAEATNRLPVMA